MKKIIAAVLTFALVFSLAVPSFAINRQAFDEYNALQTFSETNAKAYTNEGAEINAGNKDTYMTSDIDSIEKGSVRFVGEKINDYVDFFLPVKQKGKYEIKMKVKKGPNAPKLRLYFPDINQYVGESIDLYAPTETFEEVKVNDWYLDTGTRQFRFIITGTQNGFETTFDSFSLKFVSKFVAESAIYPYFDEGEAPIVEQGGLYQWGQVYESGTGCSTHLVFHPKEKGLFYLGTDMGGCYIWDDEKYHWKSISDNLPSEANNYLSCDSIGLDANNPDVIYVAYGLKARQDREGGILKSYDRGENWIDTGFKGFFCANDAFRDTHECIAVDPNNSNNVWVATANNGLFISHDGFKTWENCEMPVTLETIKVFPRCILFDPNSPKDANGSKKVYVLVEGAGIFVTEDAGESWNYLEGAPTTAYNMEIANDGTMVVGDSAGKALWLYKNNTWTNIAPDPEGYFSVPAIDPNNSDYIVCGWKQGPTGSYNEWVYYTTDGGKNWRLINDTLNKSFFSIRPEASAMFCNVSDIAMDPFDSKRVFFAGWNQFYMTDDIFADTIKLTNYSRGIEHGVVLNTVNPPSGANLFVVARDYGGSRFTDITQYPEEQLFPKGSPKPTAFMESNPNYMVRSAKGSGGFSTNNGIDWCYFKTMPNANKAMNDLELSADFNPETGNPAIYMHAKGQPIHVSYDFGTTWFDASGIGNMGGSDYASKGTIAADRKDANIVYVLNGDTVYKSEDFGKKFEVIQTLKNANDIQTTWGKHAAIWVLADGKAYYSTTQGLLFKELKTDIVASAMAFGKEAPDSEYPTIFLYGEKGAQRGVFRSTDNGKSWICCFDQNVEKYKLMSYMNIGADRQYFGLVYVTSDGRGIHYGYPVGEKDPFFKNREHAIQVVVNKQCIIYTDTEPKLVNDRTMVPMRQTFECMGASIEWDEATETITATRRVYDHWKDETTVIKMQIGSNTIYVNGEARTTDVAPMLDGDRTLIPLRFISEVYDAEVTWNDDTQCAYIEM